MKTIREFINKSDEQLIVTFKDPMGNPKKIGTKSFGFKDALSNFEWALKDNDRKIIYREGGGNKRVSDYLKDVIAMASIDAKNNNDFAKNLNKLINIKSKGK